MGDSTNPTKYNFPYRTNFEAYQLVTWWVAAATLCAIPYIVQVPKQPYVLAAIGCFFMGVFTGHRCVEMAIKKKRLKGYPLEFIDQTDPKVMRMFGIDKEVIARVQKNKKAKH
ncbi:hypothetical protein [Vibrio coralliilyticus]|uniref:Conjugal transfer protein n=1 Tax=Vibrio coralliilyticus TaxID=190893 RepID=A0AAP6ZSU1_9VIBR|nr:hypothetical protein [Vibrio coralliilyticus]NOI31831.1 hypothetical protein [Vibrio coralliilyticus]NOJ25275.1 hypothetical protein [Vibrio coralliilyticus]